MNAEMYALHEILEETHWWHVARRDIVLHLLRREIGSAERALRIVDVGCGTGGMLAHLQTFGTVIGVDPSPDAVAYAAEKKTAEVRVGTLPDSLPFSPTDRFDVITLLDVVEHVDEDVASLITLRRLLRPDGLLLLTVPAYQFLWSGHDLVNEHKRRYSRTQLRETLEAAGFEVGMISYYNTSLFPAIAGVRLMKRWTGRSEIGDLGAVPGPLNALLRTIFGAERHVLGRVPLPFGVSLIAMARPRDGRGTT